LFWVITTATTYTYIYYSVWSSIARTYEKGKKGGTFHNSLRTLSSTSINVHWTQREYSGYLGCAKEMDNLKSRVDAGVAISFESTRLPQRRRGPQAVLPGPAGASPHFRPLRAISRHRDKEESEAVKELCDTVQRLPQTNQFILQQIMKLLSQWPRRPAPNKDETL